MKVEISKEDIREAKLRLAQNDILVANLEADESEKIKKCYMAYKHLEEVLKSYGVDLDG